MQSATAQTDLITCALGVKVAAILPDLTFTGGIDRRPHHAQVNSRVRERRCRRSLPSEPDVTVSHHL